MSGQFALFLHHTVSFPQAAKAREKNYNFLLISQTMANAVLEGRQGEQLEVTDEAVKAEEGEVVDETPRAPQKRASKTAEEIANQ